MIMTQQETSCGAILYYLENSQPKYLAIQHKNGGHWAFAKGHVEENESEKETALREIKEETGLDSVTLDTNFREVTSYFPKAEVEKRVIYFIAEVSKEQAEKVVNQEAEVLESDWLQYNDALDIITYQNDRELLEKAHNYVNSHKL